MGRPHVQPQMPVYAGVIVLASSVMARNLARTIPDITDPELIRRPRGSRSERRRRGRVRTALAIRDTGAFQGVHLIPVSCYRPVAARLEQLLGPSVTGDSCAWSCREPREIHQARNGLAALCSPEPALIRRPTALVVRLADVSRGTELPRTEGVMSDQRRTGDKQSSSQNHEQYRNAPKERA